MTEPLRRFFYVSRATLEPTDVPPLVERARTFNAANAIAGVLLFTGGHFAQVIEGPPQVIIELAQRIVADPRHEAVRVLLDDDIAQREHGEWSMRLLEAPHADELLRMLVEGPVPDELRVLRLLRSFKESG